MLPFGVIVENFLTMFLHHGQASVELQGIKGLWSLRSSINDPYDSLLVVSFISETRVLAMNMDDELEESEIEGFCAEAQTLFCQNAIHDQLIQVQFHLGYFLWLYLSLDNFQAKCCSL